MGNKKPKHLNRDDLVPKYDPSKKDAPKYLNKELIKFKEGAGDNANVFVSIRLVQHAYQCFCEWEKIDMTPFWGFIDEVHKYTWQQVKDTSRKEDKKGLGCTVMPRSTYPDSPFLKSLDPQVTFIEMRVDKRRRVHGFRDDAIFYICWLDKDHALG